MADKTTEKSLVKGLISLPRNVNKADVLRAVLYKTTGPVTMSLSTEGIKGKALQTNENAILARRAILDGDDGTAMAVLLSGGGLFNATEKVDAFSFRKANTAETIAAALADYGK